MGKVIVANHLTLDGVMQGPGSVDEDPRDGFSNGGWANLHTDAVVGEAMVAVVLAEALLDKFGHDNMTDIRASHNAYRQRLRDAIRSPEGAKGRS